MLPNLAPKIQQDRSKIDAKMHYTRKVLDEIKYSGMAWRNARSDPPPNGDGVLDGWIEFANLLGSIFQGQVSFRSLPNPLPNPLPEAAHSARPTLLAHPWRTPGAPWLKKSRSKRPSKTYQILMPFQHRFLSVLVPFWKAKMASKSIKNQSKLSIHFGSSP